MVGGFYSRVVAERCTDDDDMDADEWKKLHGDVLRAPVHPELLSAVCGEDFLRPVTCQGSAWL